MSTKFLRAVTSFAPATRHRRRDLPPHARLTSDTIENATTPAVTTTAPATAGLIPRTSASATPSCLAADLTIEAASAEISEADLRETWANPAVTMRFVAPVQLSNVDVPLRGCEGV